MLEDLAYRFFIVVDEVLHRKFSFQVLLHCQIQQGIDWMLALLLSDLCYSFASQVLVLVQMYIIDERRVPLKHTHLALFTVTPPHIRRYCASLRTVHVPPQRRASGRV